MLTGWVRSLITLLVMVVFYSLDFVTTYPLSILVIASRRRRRSNPLACREIAFPRCARDMRYARNDKRQRVLH